jgi:hypothetical protein
VFRVTSTKHGKENYLVVSAIFWLYTDYRCVCVFVGEVVTRQLTLRSESVPIRTAPHFTEPLSVCISELNTHSLSCHCILSPSVRLRNEFLQTLFLQKQEIADILCNQQVHYRVHNSMPLYCILTQINSGHVHSSSLFINHFNIILSSIPRSSEWFLSFKSGYEDSLSSISVVLQTFHIHRSYFLDCFHYHSHTHTHVRTHTRHAKYIYNLYCLEQITEANTLSNLSCQ